MIWLLSCSGKPSMQWKVFSLTSSFVAVSALATASKSKTSLGFVGEEKNEENYI